MLSLCFVRRDTLGHCRLAVACPKGVCVKPDTLTAENEKRVLISLLVTLEMALGLTPLPKEKIPL